MAASDDDSTADLRYSMTSDIFTVDTLTGRITTLVSLDRELTSNYLVNVSVTDGIHTDLTSISIVVLDTNDNAPEFSQETFSISITDDVKVDTPVLTVEADDADLMNNGMVTYWIHGTEGKFQIDPSSGIITISGSLDARAKYRYVMLVFAMDHGYPPLLSNVSVIINVNESREHALTFDRFSYHVSVREDASLNVEIFKVTLSASAIPTTDVRFTISEGDVDDTFGVDARGALGIMKPLDFEVKRHYSLTISAVDSRGLASSATVVVTVSVIDVNDNSPTFLPSPKVIRLLGPLDEGKVIFKVIAMDADSGENGDMTYSIIQNTQDGNFTIDPHSGEIVTNLTIPVGRYDVSVMASDHGSPRLSAHQQLMVYVLDNRAAALYPMFHQAWYRVRVNESVTVPHVLEDVNAVIGDKGNDKDVYYTLDAREHDGLFEVDTQTVSWPV